MGNLKKAEGNYARDFELFPIEDNFHNPMFGNGIDKNTVL
jgi:hypothetical protein